MKRPKSLKQACQKDRRTEANGSIATLSFEDHLVAQASKRRRLLIDGWRHKADLVGMPARHDVCVARLG